MHRFTRPGSPPASSSPAPCLLFGLVLLLPLLVAARCGRDPGAASSPDAGPVPTTGAPGTTGPTSCAVYEVVRQSCESGADETTVTRIECQAGDACTTPSPYNDEHPAIMCIDEYRYRRRDYPATCQEIADFEAGLLECLTPYHCADDEAYGGDWICTAAHTCECPVGGFCPTPGPPSMRADAGAELYPDAGVAGPGIPDAGPAVSHPSYPDAGTPAPPPGPGLPAPPPG